MKPTFSFLWGVVFPWIVSLPLINQPDALNNFISYSSLIFVSVTDFVLPLCLYIAVQSRKKALGKVEAVCVLPLALFLSSLACEHPTILGIWCHSFLLFPFYLFFKGGSNKESLMNYAGSRFIEFD